MKIINRLSSRYSKVTPLPAGTYHLQTDLEGTPYRLHLRLHEDGTGLLIVNASTVLQLNATLSQLNDPSCRRVSACTGQLSRTGSQ